MNGLNSISSSNATGGANGPDSADFDTAFSEGITNSAAVIMQFIASDVIESVMKDETAVD